MTLDIIYKDYGNYMIYPLNKTSYFKIGNSYHDHYEYYLTLNNKTFYADNVNIYPLDIYDSRNRANYFASILFGDAFKDKVIYEKSIDNKLNIKIVEYNSFLSKEIVCKKNEVQIFKIQESKLALSKAKLTLTFETFKNNELELFIALLSFVVNYDDRRN